MTDLTIDVSGDFAAALKAANATLVFSVYHAGKLILLNVDSGGRLRLTPIAYPKPMGIAVQNEHLAVTTLDEIHLYADSPKLAGWVEPGARSFEHVYFPRLTYYCGPLDLHDVCFVDGEIWAVNTLFSCIASFDKHCNFTPRWTPHFISAVAPEDRCHLNGMALQDGRPQFATALSSGNSEFSWRATQLTSGILMSIPENEILLHGLAMPHSPRIEGESVYLLESAAGALVHISTRDWHKETVTTLKGMVRGLCIRGDTAFVGISMARERSAVFPHLPETAKAEHAAIHAIDLRSGETRGSIRFLSLVEEIYDIQAIPFASSVGILGLYDERRKQAVSTPDEVFWRKTPPGKPRAK